MIKSTRRHRTFEWISAALLLSVFACSASWALVIESAVIVDDAVEIRGSDADPNAAVLWKEEEVGETNPHGKFHFSSNDVPLPPRCLGQLQVGSEFMIVEVDNCRGPIEGFYTAPQDQKLVPPGDFDGVRSFCDFGDFAVSGQMVIRGEADPADFRIISFGLVIDGQSEQQSWVLEGVNTGTAEADIRISARCARVLPPPKKTKAMMWKSDD